MPFRAIVLLVTVIGSGLMAGLFAAFSYAIMPALKRTDDQSFVSVMNHINKVIVNGFFLSCFVGTLVLGILATVLHWSTGRPALTWIVVGTALYLVMFLITGGINVPLNDKLAAAAADPAGARAAFETTWNTWNLVRAVVNTAAFACFAYALWAGATS